MSVATVATPTIGPEQGYLMLMRGLAWERKRDPDNPDGPKKGGYVPQRHGPLYNWRDLPRRAGSLGTILFLHIQDRTRSAYAGPQEPAPEWAEIPLSAFVD